MAVDALVRRPSETSALMVLTHLPLDKMAVISQTIFPDAFLRMKSFVF